MNENKVVTGTDESMPNLVRFQWVVVVLVVVLNALFNTGCAAFTGKGIEAYAGIRAMDERQVSEQTHPAVPWKCYFVSCAGEGKGS
jgi:hypothetical protein